MAGEIPVRAAEPKQALREMLEKKTARRLSVVAESGREGLRCNLWRKKVSTGERIVAHFVNYYCPIPIDVQMGKGEFKVQGPSERYAPKPVEGATVRLDIAADRVQSITAYDPDSTQSAAIRAKRAGAGIEFALPAVRIYKIVKIDLSPK